MWTVLGAGIFLAALAGAGSLAAYGINDRQLNRTEKSFNEMKQALNDNGLGNVSLEDIVDEAYKQNWLTDAEKDKYKNIAKNIKDVDRYYSNQAVQDGFWDTLGDEASRFSKVFELDKYGKDGEEFYKFLKEYAPEFVKYKSNGMITGESIANAIMSGTPNYTVTAPNYLEDPGMPELQDVEPVKRWTGPELAEFHDIPYDIASYYDLLKQGTEAAVDYAKYTNAQANETSMFNDTQKGVDYLDAIRNVRADAIANGSTLGAKYANELLANKEAIDNYAAEQMSVADKAMSVLESPINENARVKTNTREYFDKLALNVEDIINKLYENDTVRFSQDWLNNAERYRSGVNLRNSIIGANAAMNSAYNTNSALASVANAKNREQADDYAFLFDNVVLPATGYDVNSAAYLMDNILQRNQTGYSSHENLISNLTNKNK